MTPAQIITLLVFVGVVIALISERIRPDVAALSAAALLTFLGVAKLQDLQHGLASPAVIALGSLFVLVTALEHTGVLSLLLRASSRLATRLGRAAPVVLISACGGLSAVLNNTPIVVLAAPMLRDLADRNGWNGKRLLLPLSYAAVLGGGCTLIGTSTNLLVDDMAQKAGMKAFGLLEITPVGLTIAAVGGLYLLLVAPRLLPAGDIAAAPAPGELTEFKAGPALFTLAIFAFVLGATFGGMPLHMAAFAGAASLLLSRVLPPERAYSGLQPQVLLMIGGMLVVGAALETSGLAGLATDMIGHWAAPLGPLATLALLYAATSLLTEVMSNAAVAVLATPLAVALAANLGVDPRPFAVGVMMAASASFATPFGYQTNTFVYRLGGYRYLDFVRVGLPLNVLTGATAVLIIPRVFPF